MAGEREETIKILFSVDGGINEVRYKLAKDKLMMGG